MATAAETSPGRSADEKACPADTPLFILERWLVLLLLGLAVLAALAGGDDPSAASRERVCLLCALLALVALLATWNRCSGVGEPALLDGLVVLALPLAVFANIKSPLPSQASVAIVWQVSLLAVYFAARLIGPSLLRPALALWGAAIVALAVAGRLWPERLDVSRTVLLEWATAFVLFLACWGRQTWARRIQTTGLFWMRRTMLLTLIAGCALIHLLHVSHGHLGEFLHQRALGVRTGIALFAAHPVWGWGGGSWRFAEASLASPPAAGETVIVGAPSWVFVSGGLAGAMSFATVTLGLYVTLLLARRPDQPSRMGTPLMATASITLAWSAMGLWALTPVRPANLIILGFFAGTALSLNLVGIPDRPPLTPLRHRWRHFVWSLAILGDLALVAALAARPAFACWIRHAGDAREAADRARAAARWMPWRIEWPLTEAQMAGAAALDSRGANVATLFTRRWDCFARAHALNPHDETPIVTPADEMAGQGQLASAEAILRAGLDDVPLSETMRLALASLLEQRGEAGEAFNVLREIDPIHPRGSTKVTLARLAWQLGARDQAERYAREAVQLDNRSPALQALLREMHSPLLDLLEHGPEPSATPSP